MKVKRYFCKLGEKEYIYNVERKALYHCGIIVKHITIKELVDYMDFVATYRKGYYI